MKSKFKNLLSVLGGFALVASLTGCETEAEDTAQVPVVTNTVAEATSSAAATNGDAKAAETNPSITAGPMEAGATNVAGSTNGVVNQQATIVNRIPATLPPNLKLSKGVEEVVKLAQAGVSETVLLLFIEKSTEPFELDAADILYLNDIGISSTVLAGMLNHDGQGEDVLHDALNTGTNAVAAAPPLQSAPLAAASVPPMEVSSNYVAAPQYGGTVIDPNAQQPAIIQQQPVIVQQPAVVVTQPAVTYSYFYSSLSPYGSWVEVPDYGWCWQPTIAVTHRGWRPYVHGGRWLNSDAGWYWSSDYSWGWAPFHYGRWHCSPRAGWVWTPDYTWGPSWVTWRRSGDYCGWAPLPPRCNVRPGVGFSYWGRDVGFSFNFGYSHDYYTFVPTRRFCDRRVIDHVVPTGNTVNIYKDSTVVNNYIVGNNNTIINNGIGRDYVANHTRNEIPRVRVAEASAAGRPIAPDKVHRDGNELVVYRPNRPSANLVAAHEAAVARTRNETARPADGSENGRGNLVPTRPGRPEPVSPALGAATATKGGSAAAPRSETMRPQVASRGNSTPVFGTPAPIRPEPDRSAEIIRSRASQEARVRPGANATLGGSTGTATSPGSSPTIRPNSSGRSIAPRFSPDTSTPAGSPGVVSGQSARPGAPVGNTTPGSSRTEVGRGTTGSTVTAPPQGRVETARPAPSASSPSFRRGTSEPARSPDLATPQASRPAPVTQTPAFSRPVPGTTQSGTAPASRPPVWSRPAAPQQQGNVTISPQPIQRSAPAYQAPAPAARPNVISRSEGFSRPSTPVQSAPAPSVVQPRSITPVQRPAPAFRPQQSAPSASAPAPVVRSAPPQSSAPRISSAPINGGSFRSAPPAQAARPSATPSSPPRTESRGRVEIGR